MSELKEDESPLDKRGRTQSEKLLERSNAAMERGKAALQRSAAAIRRSEAARDRANAALVRSADSHERASARVVQFISGSEAEPTSAVDERERLEECKTLEDERSRVADLREVRADERERTADERDRVADERDQIADERDRIADERERRADEREPSFEELEGQYSALHGQTVEQLRAFAKIESFIAKTLRDAAVSANPSAGERRLRLADRAEEGRAWALKRIGELESRSQQAPGQPDIVSQTP